MPVEIITPDEFTERMNYLKEHPGLKNDKEAQHIVMDALMCEVLEQLGYAEGVEIFENTPKWYA